LPAQFEGASDLRVIIPNLHWRYSGVTATNRMVAPKLAAMQPAVWFGPDKPDGIEALDVGGLLKLWRGPAPLIWHARRNNEMIAGLVLRALGWPLKLVFTSAAQRHHTWITRWLIARMDAIIATSEASASYLKRAARVIPHGVDTDVYAPADDREALLREAGLAGKLAIGCFGRVRAQKGTDVFVDALCAVLPCHPDAIGVIVGQITPDQAAFADGLRETIAKAGLQSRILMLGELPIEEVRRWFNRLSIYAFTSRNEGFGLTLIEAMACGLALVAARAGAAELVVEDGESGILMPTGDAPALAAALERLLSDPASIAAMGTKARARVLASFNLEAEARAISEVYRSVG
jgi:mannosyltransferase